MSSKLSAKSSRSSAGRSPGGRSTGGTGGRKSTAGSARSGKRGMGGPPSSGGGGKGSAGGRPSRPHATSDTRSAVERDLLVPSRAWVEGGLEGGEVGGEGEERIPSPELTALQNPAADPRTMRRIIAEDSDWSLATVPALNELCINNIVNTFDRSSSMLNKLPPKSRAKVLERLSPSVPTRVTARLVDDDSYWRRRCLATWTVCDVTRHGGRWKRMFFERNLQDLIERFVPESTDPHELSETLDFSSNYIRSLDIRQLLPPIKELVPAGGMSRGRGGDASDPSEGGGTERGEGGSDAGSDDPLVEHFDFNTVLPRLPFLEEFSVRYGVRNCGMNFDWNLFMFTSRDCQLLAKCVASCRTLRCLTLHHSKVDDAKVRTLIAHLLDHPVLHSLDLSHNLVADRGARAVAKFVNNRSQLTTLRLCSNNIGATGAQAIAHALTKNTTMTSLDLRLNHVGDEGGQALCRALLRNATLLELNLAANEMGEPVATSMARVLKENSTLERIDLSCNQLGPEGGRQLQEGMEGNRVVTQLDLRLTDCGQDAEFCIQQAVTENRNKNNDLANESARQD